MERVRAVSMVGAAHSMQDLRRPSRVRMRQAAVEETKNWPRCRGHGKSSHGRCGSKVAGMTTWRVFHPVRDQHQPHTAQHHVTPRCTPSYDRS